MKLALVALAIELGLARIIAGSWLWAAVIVVAYCLFVYVRQTKFIKRSDADRTSSGGNITIQNRLISKLEREIYETRMISNS